MMAIARKHYGSAAICPTENQSNSPMTKANSTPYFVHALADCQSTDIGEQSNIWQFTVILPNAAIGSNCNINSHCFIENDVTIGNNVTIKCGVYLWDGIRIEDNVFIGPNATFTNDKTPRSKVYPEQFLKTHIMEGASIGAGAVLLPGICIGRRAMIGAGAVVTRDVPDDGVIYGDGARLRVITRSEPR